MVAQIEDLLGRRYRDLKAEGVLGPDMPEPEPMDDRSHVSLIDQGVSFVLPDHVHVGAIQLHAEGHESFAAYRGRIPGSIAFAMSREEVRKKLGEPKKSGEVTKLPILGTKPAWDSYAIGSMHVHIQYTMNASRVQLVSLLPL
ncbi:MAG: hypothetical protein EOO30_05770 [Comamonadaceae bacterium]|nr:MAG: hypothetical protein EOO30_05770 [Comamonadaceae bacterium]